MDIFHGKADIKLRKELEHVKAAYLWRHHYITLFLTFIGPHIANIFAEYNQQGATFLNLFISVRRSTCFRRFFLRSSGAQNCTYRPLLLPAAGLARPAAGSSTGLTNT